MQAASLRDASGGLDEILARVRKVADRVGLRDYAFEVRVATLPDGVRATCRCADGRAYAVITVDDAFFELSREEQDEALVHETLHPLFHRLMAHVCDLRDELGRAHFENLERVFRRDLEHVVDALTTALTQ